MKQFTTGVLLIFLQANHAFSQTEKPAIVANFNGNYIKSGGYRQIVRSNRFNLILPTPPECHSSVYSTIGMYNNNTPYQEIKTPLLHGVMSIAGQLSLSVFAERHQLYYHSPARSYRYPVHYNHH